MVSDGSGDARFEDSFKPMRILAYDTGDLAVLSALLQDMIVKPTEMAWEKPTRRFAMIGNRFRWEKQAFKERVRTATHFEGVADVRSKGFNPKADAPLALLSVSFVEGVTAPAGEVRIAFSGGGEVAITVEALEAALTDLSQPWSAGATPQHFTGV
jgi:hypothetical protein